MRVSQAVLTLLAEQPLTYGELLQVFRIPTNSPQNEGKHLSLKTVLGQLQDKRKIRFDLATRQYQLMSND